MDRILPEALSVPIALAIEKVYAYGPMAEKTVVLGKKKEILLVTSNASCTLLLIVAMIFNVFWVFDSHTIYRFFKTLLSILCMANTATMFIDTIMVHDNIHTT